MPEMMPVPVQYPLTRLALCCLCLLSLAAVAFAEEADSADGHISGEIFGKKARWYHAYLSVYEAYDDNIFNTEAQTESDLITVISPGIQLTVPGTDQPAEEIVTDTTSPGGLTFGRFTERSYRRFRAHVGYAPWFQFYADHSDENVANHSAQAGLQFNLRGGLSFDLVNRFVKDFDRLVSNRSTQSDHYYSNLFSLIVTYPLSPKFELRADYAHNLIEYLDDDTNGFRNRADNSGAAFIFYKFQPKTAAFIEYRYTEIDYDTDNNRDGSQQNAAAGLVWEITAKTSGRFQAGYGTRRYDAEVYDDSDSLLFQTTVDYHFSPKTQVGISLSHSIAESTESIYDHTLTTGAALTYRQALRHNLNFDCQLSYRHLDYQGGRAEASDLPDRQDDIWSITPSLSYAFRRWLSASVAYNYRDRDSDVETGSFRGNTVIIKLTGSI
jgi:hypothetical protein